MKEQKYKMYIRYTYILLEIITKLSVLKICINATNIHCFVYVSPTKLVNIHMNHKNHNGNMFSNINQLDRLPISIFE